MQLFFHSTNTKAQCDTLIKTHKYNLSAGQKKRLHIFEASLKNLNTHHLPLRWCFPSIFFWLICRGRVKNVFNVLCLRWVSLGTIDSWRDSLSLRGASSASFSRVRDVTIRGDHESQESSSGGRTQPLTALCSCKTCQMHGTLKIHLSPVFFPDFPLLFTLAWG